MPLPASQMGMQWVSALSDAADPSEALAGVLDTLEGSLAARPADVMLMFCSGHESGVAQAFHHTLLDVLQPAHTLGCTCSGVIGRRCDIEQGYGLSVLLGHVPGARLHTFTADDLQDVMDDEQAVRAAMTGGDLDAVPRGVVLLADPFSTPLSKLLPAMSRSIGDVPIVGGLASGSSVPHGNRLFHDSHWTDRGAVGLTFSGDVELQATVFQGCRPVGKPLVITKAKRNIVQQLGGVNALKAIREVASSLSEADRVLLQDGPLLIGRVVNEYQSRFGVGDFVVRSLNIADEEAGTLTISDTQVRVGQTIQLHVNDPATATGDLDMLLDQQHMHGPAAATLLFSCVARGNAFFAQPHTEPQRVASALDNPPLSGFFADGEFGPVRGQNSLNTYAASLVSFRSPAGSSPE